jgi:Contractile injection system tube protein/LysM domain
VPDLAKAEIMEMGPGLNPVQINKNKATKVQFNPDSLKVSFSNQVANDTTSKDNNGLPGQQFVGAGATKLSITLYFDVTSQGPVGLPEVDDVRRLTQRVAYFITPKPIPENKPTKFLPPLVRFQWGSFVFDGIMESMEESLEMFSFEGRPLRATVSIGLAQQRVSAFSFNTKDLNAAPGVTRKGGAAAGTEPVTEAPAGSSLQSLANNGPGGGISLGAGIGWQAIATANGIENPRLLEPGQLLNLNPSSISASAGLDVNLNAGVNASAGLSAGISGSGSASVSASVSVDASAQFG